MFDVTQVKGRIYIYTTFFVMPLYGLIIEILFTGRGNSSYEEINDIAPVGGECKGIASAV